MVFLMPITKDKDVAIRQIVICCDCAENENKHNQTINRCASTKY